MSTAAAIRGYLVPPTWIGQQLDENRLLYKLAVIVDHFIRAMFMAAWMAVLPYSPLVNGAVALGVSVFYWATIERKCSFHFSLPSCIGGAVLPTRHALAPLISGAAFSSLNTLVSAMVAASPLLLWTLGIVYLSHIEVDGLYCRCNK